MNRDIKFKAWIKKGCESKMGEVTLINLDEKYINYIICNKKKEIEIIGLAYFDEYELMQYTGIKDKNGVEIYEGDIVLIRIDKTNILHKTVVKFKHGAFIADIIGDNDYIYLFHFGFNKDDFEVVGNIYENHKLLEEK
jgi:hypothetical protein